jgi:hypothetical protein
MARKAGRGRLRRISLVASKQAKPAIKVKPGMKLTVASVVLVDPSGKKAGPIGARLCGGTSTCLALVDVDA